MDRWPLMVDEEERFRVFVENANDILYTLTPEGIFSYVSPNWTEFLGHDAEEVLGEHFEAFVHPEDIPICRAVLQQLIATGKKKSGVQYRVKHKSGNWRWHESNASPLLDEKGEVSAFLGVARDITEKKLLEKHLTESNERLENLLLELPVAVMIVDYETRQILEINPQAVLILGYSGEQLIGRRCTDYICPTEVGQCPIIDLGMEVNHSEREVVNASGARIPVHKSAITMHLDERKVILECFTDISRMKEMERRLQEMARTDELTGIYNRRYFMEQAGKEIARARRYKHPLSMISFDIDHFKDINDRYGHPAGDEVLRSVSRVCRDMLRENDVFARLGGEEFGVLLPDTGIEAAGRAAERLREEIAAHACRVEKSDIRCTVSLGGAEYAGPEDDLENLMKRTDKALYRAKHSGRNRVRLFREDS
jgi:diguanylate cyclase (GGDEF)-like protein/PAS domain S-box-containing protein